jgi:hypothetical protein
MTFKQGRPAPVRAIDENRCNSGDEDYIGCRVELTELWKCPKQTQTLIGGQMKSLVASAALLSGFGALMMMGMVASTVPAAAKCMIDEGNGRYTPCSALYKSSQCMVDEGNGRHTPCSALLKQKKTAKKSK